MSILTPIDRSLDGMVLRGSVHVPDDGAKRHPTVVLHHGFNSTRLEAFGLFVQLSRLLAGRGIQTVAFDRLGQGESDGSFFDVSIDREIATCSALLDDIVRWPTVDPDELHLLGMSFGGVIASAIAAETAHPIRSLTLLSPAAVFVDDIRAGVMSGRDVQEEIDSLGYFDLGGARLGPSFFEVGRDFDVYGRAAGYSGPVRIVHGADDEVVPVEYATRYAEVYGGRAEITVVPHGDHVWTSVPTRDLLLAEVVSFLDGHVHAR